MQTALNRSITQVGRQRTVGMDQPSANVPELIYIHPVPQYSNIDRLRSPILRIISICPVLQPSNLDDRSVFCSTG